MNVPYIGVLWHKYVALHFGLCIYFLIFKTHVVLSEDHTQDYCIAECRKENGEQRLRKEGKE